MIMSNDQTNLEESDQELLVAYLDGELDGPQARLVEDRLTTDSQFRSHLQSLERSWEMLESLPISDENEQSVQTTIGMVAQKASEDLNSAQQAQQKQSIVKLVSMIAGTAVTALLGYWGFSFWLNQDNRRLADDLEVIERVDMYRNIDDLDFLMGLSDESLFGEETEDEELQ